MFYYTHVSVGGFDLGKQMITLKVNIEHIFPSAFENLGLSVHIKKKNIPQ